MKKIKYSFLLFSALLLACTQNTPKNDVLRFGNSANEKSEDLNQFAQSLEEITGLKIEFVVSKSYEDLVEQFRSGKVDFAFFSPVNFISAEKDAGAKVLLKKIYGKSEFYHSAIIVKADSPMQSMADLKGKKVAFVDPKSTSGYLYPMVSFKNAGLGLKDFEHTFEGTHEKAVQAVIDSTAVAAAVWSDEPSMGTGVWTQFENDSQKFRVLGWSEPIPNDAFAVRSDFYNKNPDKVFKIMEGLIVMSDSSNEALKKAFNTNRMTTATSRHYDSVRNLIEAQKGQ